MTKQQFENYKFSINTQIKVNDRWQDVLQICFETGMIEPKSIFTGQQIHYSNIKEIKN